jgi:hypothetical protein
MNVRQKGANGELEAAKWLHKWLRLKEIPQRNLEQVRSGGHDLTGTAPFFIEVKRCQTIQKTKWWIQAQTSTPEGGCPVVMFRQNKKKWKFLLPANLIGLDSGFIQLEVEEFLRWADKHVQEPRS